MIILYFIESMHAGGKERRLVELIKGLLSDKKSYNLHLVLMYERIHYKILESFDVSIHYLLRKSQKDFSIFRKFYKLTKQINPDFIHVWGNMPAIYAIPTKILTGIPLINNEITDAPLNVDGGLLSHRITFPFSNIIIANTKAGLDAYNAPKGRSKYIYNGFDFSRINNLVPKERLIKELNIKTPDVVGMVATFSEKKDHFTYFKAAINILAKRRDITFLAIGGGNAEKYKRFVGDNFNENIILMGAQQNVESIMNCCDIGVLTTNVNVHGEGISNALLEFMALGKVVIATKNGGNEELIDHAKEGFIVDPSDEKQLEERILQLIEDMPLRKKMSEAAKRKVEATFSITQMIESFKKVYHKYQSS
jgi:glycosyltransferase involved in cell wall biosynthesis